MHRSEAENYFSIKILLKPFRSGRNEKCKYKNTNKCEQTHANLLNFSCKSDFLISVFRHYGYKHYEFSKMKLWCDQNGLTITDMYILYIFLRSHLFTPFNPTDGFQNLFVLLLKHKAYRETLDEKCTNNRKNQLLCSQCVLQANFFVYFYLDLFAKCMRKVNINGISYFYGFLVPLSSCFRWKIHFFARKLLKDCPLNVNWVLRAQLNGLPLWTRVQERKHNVLWYNQVNCILSNINNIS